MQAKLKHTSPCKECPWRKNSLQGFLGGNSAEQYADHLQFNVIPECHLHSTYEDDETGELVEGVLCAGALATSANACILPRYAEQAEAREVVGKREDCFQHHRDFFRYHMGEDYVLPFNRPTNE